MAYVIPASARVLLDYLAIPESGGNYLAYYSKGNNKQPLPATLDGVLQFQSDLVKKRGFKSSATGRYQFMPQTLRSLMADLKLPGSTPFTNDLQDYLGYALLRRRGYNDWLTGKLSTNAFADNLSKEWASMPYRTGRSYYDGDGLNHSLVKRSAFLAAIDASRGVKEPAIPSTKPEPKLATEDPPMNTPAVVTPAIKAEIPNVDFFQGSINTIDHWIGTLTSGLAAAQDPNNTKVSASPGGTGFFGTVSNVQSAIKKLGEIVADAKKNDVQEAIADGVDLLKIGFATLSAFNINLPVVSTIFANGNINLHAGGVDKP